MRGWPLFIKLRTGVTNENLRHRHSIVACGVVVRRRSRMKPAFAFISLGAAIFILRRRCERRLAGVAGLEPVTSAVTGQRSNQLSYTPTKGDGEARKCHRKRQATS